jgi:hypothetical protein
MRPRRPDRHPATPSLPLRRRLTNATHLFRASFTTEKALLDAGRTRPGPSNDSTTCDPRGRSGMTRQLLSRTLEQVELQLTAVVPAASTSKSLSLAASLASRQIRTFTPRAAASRNDSMTSAVREHISGHVDLLHGLADQGDICSLQVRARARRPDRAAGRTRSRARAPHRARWPEGPKPPGRDSGTGDHDAPPI